MHFELIDEYLLSGAPRKADVIAKLLAERSTLPAAAAFYEGMRMLGARTPDLTLVALRLVLAGKRADDASVVELRGHAEAARAGGPGAGAARDAYRRALAMVIIAFVALWGGRVPASAQTAAPTAANVYRSLQSGGSPHPASEIRGRIVSVDYPGGLLLVRDGSQNKTVAVVPTTTIYRHGGYGTFTDLRAGQAVRISVYTVGGRLIAQTIRI